MHSKNETLTIGWCDNGMVDGKFVEGLTSLMLSKDISSILKNKIRVSGNQIGRQRQTLLDGWINEAKTDWLLWIDSDVVVTPQAFKLIWDAADKLIAPVVSGIYFVSKENEQSLMTPFPVIFNETNDEFTIEIIHPLPENQLIKVDSAGFGFLLMHKSIVEPLRKMVGDYSLFAEKEYDTNRYVSEDIVFFRNLKKVGIPLHAHTGAVVQHMKRFSFDYNFYKLYWASIENGTIVKNG